MTETENLDDFRYVPEKSWRLPPRHALKCIRRRILTQLQCADVQHHGPPFFGSERRSVAAHLSLAIGDRVINPTHRLLLRRKGLNYARRLRAMMDGYHSRRVVRFALEDSLFGWINHVRYGDTWGLRKALLKDVRL